MAKLLHDMTTDQKGSLSVLTGQKGTGKTLVLQQVKLLYPAPHYVLIDCEEKDELGIVIDIIDSLSSLLGKDLNLELVLKIDFTAAWTMMLSLLGKLTSPFVLILYGTEYVKQSLVKKLMAITEKLKNFNLVLSFNVVGSSFRVLDNHESDLKLSFNQYSHSDLYQITKDRCDLAFPNGLTKSSISYIVDIISEFGTKVPGTCVNYLKEIYPTVIQEKSIDAEGLRKLSQYFFDGQSLEAISLADFIIESDEVERLVLDNMVSYFKDADHSYIPFKEMKNAYLMGIEPFGYEKSSSEFAQIIKRLNDNMILLPSPLQIPESKRKYGIYPISHYLTIPADEVSELLSVCYGDPDDERY